MDTEELKKFARNKIEADDLTKQVRKRIKETIWEKQNLREGFTETFWPLISQFEKPEDSKTKNIFTQNQEMLQNQLALTEGLKDNQKAITDGFSQFERLADMKELPGVEAIDDEKDYKISETKDSEAKILRFDNEYFDKGLTEEDIKTLKNHGFEVPSYYLDKDIEMITNDLDIVEKKLNFVREEKKSSIIFKNKEGFSVASPKNKSPRKETLDHIKEYNTFSVFNENLKKVFAYKEKLEEQYGSGMFTINPKEILRRFELINGSLEAGNNGVLPEYIELSHKLRDQGVINNNQLNKLLRKVI